jgi:uncharacterized protein
MPSTPQLIVNLTRGNVLCDRALLADTPVRRARGLLGRPALRPGDGLLLQPAPSIHTAFVRFEFDAVFLDSTLRIVRVVERVRPWRIVSAQRAFSVLELAAGEITRRGAAVGDQIVVSDLPEVTAPVVAGPHGPATRVLLVGSDRRFRSVTAALLQRRGYEVSVGEQAELVELATRMAAQVVVVDAGGRPAVAALEVARLEALEPAIGFIVVGEAPGALAKWGPIEELSEAIDAARVG